MVVLYVIDFLSLISSILAVVFLLHSWKNTFTHKTNLLIIGLIIMNLINLLVNLADIPSGNDSPEPFSAYYEVIEPILWTFIFFAILQEIANKNLKKSEKRYHEAFNNANLYKNLLAHDFKNIINGIGLAIQLIERNSEKPEKIEYINKFLKEIKVLIKNGTNIIENIQKLLFLEESEKNLKETEILELLKKSIIFAKNLFPDKIMNIELLNSYDIIYVKANEFLLEVFENIIINSVKHNSSNKIEIVIRVSKEIISNISQIKIEFIDNGPGIPDSSKESIFYRNFKKELSSEGMGFALSIVKKIISSYNGEIWVEDSVNGDHSKGSNFIIIIPEIVDTKK